MTKTLLYVLAAIFISIPIASGIDSLPDKTILANKFIQVVTVNQYILGLTENGVVVLDWSGTDSLFIQKTFFPNRPSPKSMKVFGNKLVVQSFDYDLTFFDVGNLPDLNLLGTVSPSVSYYDFAVVSNDLYLSRWFDGVDRYRINNFSELQFIANEKTPVVATQLERQGNWLYVLDMYNGIVRYALSLGFGNVVERLLVDVRPFSFSLIDEFVFISKSQDGVLIGQFNESTGEIIAEIENIPSPERVLQFESSFVFISPRELNISNYDFALDYSVSTEAKITEGSLYEFGQKTFMIAPGAATGLTKIDLGDDFESIESLKRAGPINSVLVNNDILFTGGDGNPLEAYQIEQDSLLKPQLLRGELSGVSDLAIQSDRLFCLYGEDNLVVEFDLSYTDEIMAVDSFPFLIEGAEKIVIYDSLILLVGKSKIQAFTNSQLSSAVWSFDEPNVEAAVSDNHLYVTSSFGRIASYEIQSDLQLYNCNEKNLTGSGWAMTPSENQLLVFVGNTMTAFDNCLELDTIVHLQQLVLDAQIRNDVLLTAGPDGIAKYDISSGLPVFIEAGGIKGSQVSTDGNTIVTTDGGSVNIYFKDPAIDSDENETDSSNRILLYENFPDPFNSTTNIQFEIPVNANIELSIYNLLGQRVKTLLNETRSGGRYLLSWNGKDSRGNEVGTGIYFYRLRVDDKSISHKMLLIK